MFRESVLNSVGEESLPNQIMSRSVETQTESIQLCDLGNNITVEDTSEADSLVNVNATQQELQIEVLVKLYEVQQGQVEQRKVLRKPRRMKKARMLIRDINAIGDQLVAEMGYTSLSNINHLVYSIAQVITNKVNGPETELQIREMGEPKWQTRIQGKIAEYRKDLSRLVEIRKRKMSLNNRIAQEVLRKYGATTPNEMEKSIEMLKQQILAKTQKINRYRKRVQQYKDNQSYNNNRKQFFRILRGKSTVTFQGMPDKERMANYWKSIYEEESQYNKHAEWLEGVPQAKSEMQWLNITEKEVSNAVRLTQNWKSPGLDKIPNFWLKNLTFLHKHLANIYNEIIASTCVENSGIVGGNNEDDSEQAIFPNWLTLGLTIMLPKTESGEDPKDYRPITCLSTMFKTLTSIIATRIYKYLQDNNIAPVEQKGCCKNSFGCKDQILISKMISNDCRKKKADLAMSWIDYQKAFDSVPHDWILKSLQLCGVSGNIIAFCAYMMRKWRINMVINKGSTQHRISEIKIKRGIFQGDSLSPLLFCISLYPLTTVLNRIPYGYKLSNSTERFNHLLYMDDLKIFNENEEQLRISLRKVKEFSDDIRMHFGVEKCATIVIRNGIQVSAENICLDHNTEIKNLEPGAVYKYLGFMENIGISNIEMKRNLKKEYFSRVRSVLRSELNIKNKFEAINTFATPVLQYSFGIIDWNQDELSEIDRKTRKILTLFKAHHPSADINRLYVNRRSGGRGLRQILSTHHSTIVNMANYLNRNAPKDTLIDIVKKYDDEDNRFSSLSKRARRVINSLGIASEFNSELDYNKRKEIIMSALNLVNERGWKEKPMHGQYIRNLEEQPLNKSKSLQWLIAGSLKAETESLIIAAQDQALHTNYLGNKVFGTRDSPLCRLCQQQVETIDHIIAGCPILAKAEYIERHDKVAAMLHFNICQNLGIRVEASVWYQHQPKPVMSMSGNSTTVIWNQQIITDRTVPQNKPDIVIRRLNQQGTEMCLLIDVAVPADSNVIRKEAEKILKYRSLQIEVSRMWKTRTEIVPVIISATGNVSQNLATYLDKIPGTHNMALLQKTAILGTAHILRKVIH